MPKTNRNRCINMLCIDILISCSGVLTLNDIMQLDPVNFMCKHAGHIYIVVRDGTKNLSWGAKNIFNHLKIIEANSFLIFLDK